MLKRLEAWLDRGRRWEWLATQVVLVLTVLGVWQKVNLATTALAGLPPLAASLLNLMVAVLAAALALVLAQVLTGRLFGGRGLAAPAGAPARQRRVRDEPTAPEPNPEVTAIVQALLPVDREVRQSPTRGIVIDREHMVVARWRSPETIAFDLPVVVRSAWVYEFGVRGLKARWRPEALSESERELPDKTESVRVAGRSAHRFVWQVEWTPRPDDREKLELASDRTSVVFIQGDGRRPVPVAQRGRRGHGDDAPCARGQPEDGEPVLVGRDEQRRHGRRRPRRGCSPTQQSPPSLAARGGAGADERRVDPGMADLLGAAEQIGARRPTTFAELGARARSSPKHRGLPEARVA